MSDDAIAIAGVGVALLMGAGPAAGIDSRQRA